MTVLMRVAALLAALVAGPAAATQDAWPALHDVSGVAPDDVLNVRAAPSATAEIVGALAPDAAGVEVVRPSEDERWGLVNVGERSGWVSLDFLDRHPGQFYGARPRIASCFGTEPFWTLDFDEPGRVLMTTPDRPATAGTELGWSIGVNRYDRYAVLIAFGGLQVGAIRLERCGDGMSDREYGIGFDLMDGEHVLSGCCTLQR